MSIIYNEIYFAKVRAIVRAKISKPTATGCTEWLGLRDKNGYGKFGFLGKLALAHRVVWRLEHGYYPKYLLCHHCDNPSCVNLEHLFVGTQLDNMRDCQRKGRRAFKIGEKGENNPCAKLTDNDVREIISQKGRESTAQMAKRFDVSKVTVGYILQGRTWQHVTGLSYVRRELKRFTADQIREIRSSELPRLELAALYGVSRGAIVKIRGRLRYAWVDAPPPQKDAEQAKEALKRGMEDLRKAIEP